MKKITKHLISILAAVTLCIGLLVSFSALNAEAATTYTSGNWTYTVSNNVATITGYTGTASNITLPTTLGGYKVQIIGADALKNNTTITNITIPEGYTSIGNYAFSKCTNLKSVSIPKTMTLIGTSSGTGCAFEGCMRLETVTMAQGGTNDAVINSRAFMGCTALKSITIPANYKTIEIEAFKGCTSLANVNIIKNSDTVIVRTINHSAFSGCTALTSVDIPEGFTSIGNYAFSGCTNLKSVSIPKTMTLIGTSSGTGCAFEGCIRLETVTMAQGGTKDTVINSRAFKGCTALKTITIPANYKTIESEAFKDCTSLANVNIIKNSDTVIVRTINHSAFSGCTALTSVDIPEGFTSVGNYAFSGCTNLKSVSIPKTMTLIGTSSGTGCAFEGCIRLETVTMAQGGTNDAVINSRAFRGCTALKTITIPANYKTIESEAFKGCTSLANVNIIKNSDTVIVRTINHSAFSGCTALTSVDIPEGYTSIGDYAFSKCTNLKSVSIPKTMTLIGTSSGTGCAFEGCIRLETVTMAQGGTNDAVINPCAFMGCTALKSITIPANYKTIASGAFKGCTSLANVIILDNDDEYFDRSIGSNGFKNCSNLTIIHIPEKVTSIGKYCFDGCPSKLVICSTSSSCVAKTYADENSIDFKVCGGVHNLPQVTTYMLTYNANGGTGAPSTQSGSTSYIISHLVPSRSGYIFSGWSKTGDSTSTKYFPGDIITLVADTVLYAVWQKSAVVTPPETEKTMSINIKNNSGSKTINYGETLELTAIVTNKPADATIVWYVDGVEKGEGETFNVSFESGTKTVEVKLVDAKGNTVTDAKGVAMTDSQTVTVKSGFFQKLISFFKNLFGVNRTVVQAIFKGVI